MYLGGVTFFINKSFGKLQLIPEANGLRFYYLPIVDNQEVPGAPGSLDLLIPIDAIGGLWATSRAFLYEFESLDENVILQGADSDGESDILIKLYRDRPKGIQGRLTGEETSWLRIVTGRAEEERRRIKLGPRDLVCIELACSAVLALASQKGTHNPKL